MIQRRKPIRRSALAPRTKPVRKRRPGPPRRGPLRDPGFLQFLRDEGICRACAIEIEHAGVPLSLWHGGCDPSHGPVNGTASKGPDNEAIPLCRSHHTEQHVIGWPAFEVKYGFLREDEAKVWWADYLIWKEHQG